MNAKVNPLVLVFISLIQISFLFLFRFFFFLTYSFFAFQKKNFSFRKIDIAIFARYIRKILLQDDTCDTPAHSFYLFSRLNPILILESQCDAHGFETRQNSWQYFLISFNDDTRGARVPPIYRLIFDRRSCVSNHRCSNRESSIHAFLFDIRMSSFCLASFLATLLRNDYSSSLFSSIILTVSFSFWSFHSKVDPISYHFVYHFTRECA